VKLEGILKGIKIDEKRIEEAKRNIKRYIYFD